MSLLLRKKSWSLIKCILQS